jgi:citrate synthase
MPPVTHISRAYPDRVEVRGKSLTDDLMGKVSFTDYFHLVLVGGCRPTTSASSSTCCARCVHYERP